MDLKMTKWMKLLEDRYYNGISNVFILSGNTMDYAVPGVAMLDYIVDRLDKMGFQDIATYDKADGLRYKKGTRIDSALDDWSLMVEQIKKQDRKKAYIIQYPELAIPNIPVSYMTETVQLMVITLHKVISSVEFLNSENIIILITDSEYSINEKFINSSSRSCSIKIELPNEAERIDMINYLKETSDVRMKEEVATGQFARLTAGLSRFNIEDIFLQAESQGCLSKEIILNKKEELMMKEYGDIIELFESEGYSFDDFAGQEHLKAYHREAIIQPMLEGDLASIPKGILYSGPPGTGKSYFARCVAGEANMTSVLLNISKLLDKYVGESEKKFEKLFMCLTALAPVIVFVDEIDQVFSRGDNDSVSVTKNIFGMFLQFLSEPSHRGKILWIGATNYPNKMDEALKRTGRFDKKIPFLPPNKTERIEIFKIHLKKTGHKLNLTDKDYIELADKTDKYTPAEIEGVVVKALEVAKRKKMSEINIDTMLYAVDCIITAQNSKIDEMIEIAIDECNDREFLPKEYRRR